MMTMLLAIVQVGLYFHLRAVAHTATRHGLDEVRVINGTPDDAVAAANAFLDQAGTSIEQRHVTAERTDTTATVRVTGTVVAVIPWLHLDLNIEVRAPVERTTP